MIVGVLFPETALSMLKAWSTQESRGEENLGVGGLRVNRTPLLASVEEAYAHAQSIYEAWHHGTSV